ncbi:LysM peptidoglycan-binding domain-containing protein [Psychrobacillus sp. NPDC096623]|uniref:cell division suppressor protein YneA n=1 Tax=Psychrobacillus sp. NPDC096623 TaxID=3364492 RepID=UPI00381205AB
MTWIKENYFLSFFVAGSIAFIMFIIISKSFSTDESQHINIEQGDSLWELAHEYGVNEDKKVWINKVMAMNNLKDEHIKAGEILKIPANEKSYHFDNETELAGDTK